MVYIYERNQTIWIETFVFKGNDNLFFNYFGISVALSSGSNQNILAIGSIAYQYQMRSFIFEKNKNGEWDLYKIYQSDRSIQVNTSYWPDTNFLLGRNYSLTLNDDTLLMGISFFTDRAELINIGSVFVASAKTIPFSLTKIAIVLAIILVVIGLVFGIVYGFMQKKSKRDKAYEPVKDEKTEIKNPIKS